MAFKRDIDDVRNSLAFKLKKILLAEGAEVHLHDPLLPYESLEQALSGADIVFVAMNHSAFEALSLERLRTLAQPEAIVCDVWNLLRTGRIVFSLAE